MRFLVTGAGGMLASALVTELAGRGAEVIARSRAELDVTDRGAVEAAIRAGRPDVVIQCAAYTAVDAAEDDEATAIRVNAESTGLLARCCQDIGALLVYPSTDYVFRGDGTAAYGPSDPVDPLNAYGRSKAAGEEAALGSRDALIVRTSWLFGAGGANFVDTMRRLGGSRPQVSVVDDQIGRPTWTATLATVIGDLVEARARGIYHATDGGEPVSWHGLAAAIFEELSLPAELVAVSSAEYEVRARRPAHSVLDCSATERLLGRTLPDWRDTVALYLTAG